LLRGEVVGIEQRVDIAVNVTEEKQSVRRNADVVTRIAHLPRERPRPVT
jgi:hypothetical protein